VLLPVGFLDGRIEGLRGHLADVAAGHRAHGGADQRARGPGDRARRGADGSRPGRGADADADRVRARGSRQRIAIGVAALAFADLLPGITQLGWHGVLLVRFRAHEK
jgi:hypothetical protein